MDKLEKMVREILNIPADAKITGIRVDLEHTMTIAIGKPEESVKTTIEPSGKKKTPKKKVIKKLHRGPSKDTREYTTSDKCLKIVKSKLSQWKFHKRLNEVEIGTLDNLNVRIKSMEPIQKDQLLNLFNRTRKRLEGGDDE